MKTVCLDRTGDSYQCCRINSKHMPGGTGCRPDFGEGEEMWIEDGSQGSSVADRGNPADGVTGGDTDRVNIGPAASFNAESECQPGAVHAMLAAGQCENQLITGVEDHRLHDLIDGTANRGRSLLGGAGSRR